MNRGGRNWDSYRGYTSRHQDDNESDHERTNAGPPPTFDGTTDFKDYKIRARLWLSTTKSKPRTRGPLLLKNLSGSAFDNFQWLANDDSWLNASDNGETLLAKMNTREYYGEDSREDMLNCLGRLTYQLERSKGENQRDFCARFEIAVRKVRDHGVQLPPEYLGFLFIMSLQLNMEEVKLLMNYTKGSLHVTDVQEWLRVHETELDSGLSSKDPSKTNDKKAVFLTEVAEGSEYQEAEENDGENSDYEILLAAADELGVDEPPEEFEEADAREILARPS